MLSGLSPARLAHILWAMWPRCAATLAKPCRISSKWCSSPGIWTSSGMAVWSSCWWDGVGGMLPVAVETGRPSDVRCRLLGAASRELSRGWELCWVGEEVAGRPTLERLFVAGGGLVLICCPALVKQPVGV